jgi:uncharacterized protein
LRAHQVPDSAVERSRLDLRSSWSSYGPAQARRQAVAAARSKAELYAEAAGVRLGAVLHIDDVDPEHGSIQVYRSAAAAGGPSPEDLAPGHVVVAAAVILGFSISHD